MKKIISFVLTLALLVSVFAALPSLAAETSLIGTDVTLTEGVSLNFYIKADGSQSVTNATPTTVNGAQCYKMTLNLGAKNMGDKLTAQLKSGSLSIGDSYEASVKDYAEKILDLTYDRATVALVNAMLGYGAAAQNYFGYKTGALVGTPVSDTEALLAADAPNAVVTDPDNIYYGASLVLEGEMLLRFYFKGNDLNVTVGGKSIATANKGDYCYADVAVMPNEIGSSVTVSCADTTVTYSPLNYLKSKVADEKLSEMAASIYAYGIAAEEYVRVSGCDHEGVTFDKAVQLPTIFNGGINEGVCPTCGGTITETVGKTEADVKKYNASSLSTDNDNNRGSFSNGVNIVEDILAGGKHFYPDAENGGKGRDLYVEFSFLYNETLKNNNKGYIDIFRIEDEKAHSSTPDKFGNYQGHTFYFLNLKNNASGQWCPYEGGFETGDIDSDAGGIFNGPPMPNHASTSTETKDDYLFIGDYGWHRMGIRVHQTAAISNGKVVYKVETSFYIDGELVSQYYTNLIASKYNDLLYTATISGGKLVYSDIADNKNFLYYKIREVMSGSTYYIATADEYATAVTVGEHANPKDGFLLDVERIEDPTYEEFKADGGITLDGTRHFKLKGDVVDVTEPESKNDSGKKLLLISVDGLRPDAIMNTDYFNVLKGMGSYTTNAKTIYPSKTMPAHMSMFHSVSPSVHGMTTNTYAPSANLGLGMTEVLAKEGYTAAMFFDWENMQYLTSVENEVERNYIQWYKTGSEEHHENSTVQLTNAILEHIENDPTDFTYLYFGMTDQMGHENGWMTDKYYYAINHIFSNILRILEAVSDEYTVIITTDHGGGGDLGIKNHGSAAAVDMTTPVFIIGDGFEPNLSLGDGVSILDIAPTVADILGVTAESYWEGKSLVTASEDAATEIFLDRDSWGEYSGHGLVKSFAPADGSLTIGVTNNGSTNMAGTQLNKAAIEEMVSLGYRYLSFTVDYAAGSKGITPGYACVYYYSVKNKAYSPADFLVTSPDRFEPGYPETYYADGRKVTLDLFTLNSYLQDGEGLIFILSNDDKWTATYDGYVTFGNIEFATSLERVESEDKRVLLVSIDGLAAYAINNSNFKSLLSDRAAYTLSAQTVNPSLTLPAHMSMFHSVTPTTHGVTTNTYAPSSSLGNGITETLSNAGLTSAMFYDWGTLKYLSTNPHGVENNSFYTGSSHNYKATIDKLTSAVIDHMNTSPTDFTFLYYGYPDATGESAGFGTEKYYTAVNDVYNSLTYVLIAARELGYTVIITADHGGGGYNGDKAHGSTSPKDMYIPVFIIGDGIEAGAELGNDVSILDIAPTVVDLLGVEAEDYWVGESLATDGEAKRTDMAQDVFFDEDTWGQYESHGKITSIKSDGSSLTIGVGNNSKTNFAGMQLNKAAVGEMISLGYRYLSFTADYEKGSYGITPGYACVYYYSDKLADQVDLDFLGKPGHIDYYYRDGEEVVIDLWGLYNVLADGDGLVFILTTKSDWIGSGSNATTTKDGKIIFSNVKLTTELD